jgi:hypothetical protein
MLCPAPCFGTVALACMSSKDVASSMDREMKPRPSPGDVYADGST